MFSVATAVQNNSPVLHNSPGERSSMESSVSVPTKPAAMELVFPRDCPSLGNERMDRLMASLLQNAVKIEGRASKEIDDPVVQRLSDKALRHPNILGDQLHRIAYIFHNYTHGSFYHDLPQDRGAGFFAGARQEMEASRNELGMLVLQCIYPEVVASTNPDFIAYMQQMCEREQRLCATKN